MFGGRNVHMTLQGQKLIISLWWDPTNYSELGSKLNRAKSKTQYYPIKPE